MAKNVLITGTTGMIGKGVLIECLNNAEINSVTLINRSNIDIKHRKIQEIIVQDFTKINDIKGQLKDIDACFHCMGVSSVGMSEQEFMVPTFEVSQKLTDMCFEINPEMTFNYVSGTGTDSSEQGRVMWANVKGKTENYILNKGFDKAYMFRPGFIIPEKGIRSRTKLYQNVYNVMRPLFPLLKRMKGITTTTKIGEAMIYTLLKPKEQITYLENKAINSLGLK